MKVWIKLGWLTCFMEEVDRGREMTGGIVFLLCCRKVGFCFGVRVLKVG